MGKKYKEIICPVCGISFSRIGQNTRSNICKKCYPKYRFAYNLVESAKYRANKAKSPYDLDVFWVLDRLKKCPYLGLDFVFGQTGKNYSHRHPLSASIDKIDPLKGYTKENCQVVSWWYNCAKQQFTNEDMYNFCRLVYENGKVHSEHSMP